MRHIEIANEERGGGRTTAQEPNDYFYRFEVDATWRPGLLYFEASGEGGSAGWPQQPRTVAAAKGRSTLFTARLVQPAAQQNQRRSDKSPQLLLPTPPVLRHPFRSLPPPPHKKLAPACTAPSWRCYPAQPPPRPGARCCRRLGFWR